MARGVATLSSDSSFDDFGLEEDLLRGIYSYGLDRPSVFQQRAIPAILNGHDVVGYAHSGCGKTHAFLIGAVAQINPQECHCQVLVLGSTRERVMNLLGAVCKLTEYLKVLELALCGGASVREQIERLRAGPQLVLGTPGRVCDLVQKGRLGLAGLRMLILDDADGLVGHGHQGTITKLFVHTPEVQVCLSSRSLNADVRQLVKRCMCSPLHVELLKPQLSLDGLQQFYISVEQEANKIDALLDLLNSLPTRQISVVIYCSTRRKAEWLSARVAAANWDVSTYHYMQPASEQRMALDAFQAGQLVLVCTEFATEVRELQVVPLIVNYDVPHDADSYLKRVGHSEQQVRVGKETAITLAVDGEMRCLREVQADLRTLIEECPMDVVDRIV